MLLSIRWTTYAHVGGGMTWRARVLLEMLQEKRLQMLVNGAAVCAATASGGKNAAALLPILPVLRPWKANTASVPATRLGKCERVRAATAPRPEEGILPRSSVHLPDGSALPNAVQKSLSQLWISKLFYLHPKTFWILCPCLPNWTSLSHYFPPPIIRVWICSSFKFGSVRAQAFCNKMPLQRSPDTAIGKAQRVKISLKIYTMGFYFIHCVFWYTKGYYS